MFNPKSAAIQAYHDPASRLLFSSVVPRDPAEAAAWSARWERRGALKRLVRVN